MNIQFTWQMLSFRIIWIPISEPLYVAASCLDLCRSWSSPSSFWRYEIEMKWLCKFALYPLWIVQLYTCACNFLSPILRKGTEVWTFMNASWCQLLTKCWQNQAIYYIEMCIYTWPLNQPTLDWDIDRWRGSRRPVKWLFLSLPGQYNHRWVRQPKLRFLSNNFNSGLRNDKYDNALA